MFANEQCPFSSFDALQVTNATTIQVRRPGNPRKWRARILCEGRLCDLALLTVDEDEFWAEAFMVLQFDDVPQLQVGSGSTTQNDQAASLIKILQDITRCFLSPKKGPGNNDTHVAGAIT